MGQRRHRASTKSHTLPSSPTHSFSSSASSEFEFATALSPRKSSAAAVDLCPADDLFYKGQLLPLHLSPRLSMVRTLLLSSASTSSSSDTTTTASRDSTASTDSSSSSSRPSSATSDADDLHLHLLLPQPPTPTPAMHRHKPPSKYFSLPKLFRKDHHLPHGGAAVKRAGSGARDVIRKYLKKVKPFYEKISQKTPTSSKSSSSSTSIKEFKIQEPSLSFEKEELMANSSFSGNLKLYSNRGKKSCFSSCPSSMGSSPSHVRNGYSLAKTGRPGSDSDSSSMEELQNAIQGAIAHCKNSMLQTKNMVSHEI